LAQGGPEEGTENLGGGLEPRKQGLVKNPSQKKSKDFGKRRGKEGERTQSKNKRGGKANPKEGTGWGGRTWRSTRVKNHPKHPQTEQKLSCKGSEMREGKRDCKGGEGQEESKREKGFKGRTGTKQNISWDTINKKRKKAKKEIQMAKRLY